MARSCIQINANFGEHLLVLWGKKDISVIRHHSVLCCQIIPVLFNWSLDDLDVLDAWSDKEPKPCFQWLMVGSHTQDTCVENKGCLDDFLGRLHTFVSTKAAFFVCCRLLQSAIYLSTWGLPLITVDSNDVNFLWRENTREILLFKWWIFYVCGIFSRYIQWNCSKMLVWCRYDDSQIIFRSISAGKIQNSAPLRWPVWLLLNLVMGTKIPRHLSVAPASCVWSSQIN